MFAKHGCDLFRKHQILHMMKPGLLSGALSVSLVGKWRGLDECIIQPRPPRSSSHIDRLAEPARIEKRYIVE